ncbi:MAG: GNAT family N-acetyltransferase, partial [Bdellovibrionota bacterium]
MSASPLQIEVLDSISRVTPEEWNALVPPDFVFADHRFLSSLEDSGCLGRRTGWHPLIVVARLEGRLAGALPLYAKTNSYGEFIFDWQWAQAAESAGLEYYPKLVGAIPFTPATGPKFLIATDTSTETSATEAISSDGIRRSLLAAARTLVAEQNFSSLHLLFTTPDETRFLESSGSLVRHSFQFHWQRRPEWKTFADYLGSLRSKRRSEVRRERESVRASGLSLELVTGEQLTREHSNLMFRFYRSTIAKMGGVPYLTENFFKTITERMPERILFVVARKPSGEAVAGALNLFGGQSLFGRYWGCDDDYRHLHFEVCYYAAIEWALANGIELFEAG